MKRIDNRWLGAVLAMMLVLAWTGVGRAQEGAAGEKPVVAEKKEAENQNPVAVDVTELVATICIFVTLVVVLRFTAWKPILQGLKSREDAIREGIEAASRAKSEAVKAGEEMETKIAQVQQEGAKQIAQAKVDAVKVAEAIKAQAETEATALKDRTVRDIEAAKQQALAEINGYAAELGTAIARKILQRDVQVTDQQRLVDEALGELAAKRN